MRWSISWRADPRGRVIADRHYVFIRDGFKCRYCGRAAPDVELQVDHVVPISKGGSDDLSNLAASCVDCNFGKRDKLLHVVKPEEEPTP